jgi:hypothetical protein
MTTGAIFWLIVFGISVILFFGIAAAITIFGFKDLKDLLTKSEKKTE